MLLINKKNTVFVATITIGFLKNVLGFDDSSYAYLFVKNEITQEEQTFCVNFEQWQTQQIAEDVKNAVSSLCG